MHNEFIGSHDNFFPFFISFKLFLKFCNRFLFDVFEQIVSFCVDSNNQRAEIFNFEFPNGFGHSQIFPRNAADFLDHVNRQSRTSARV